MQRMILNIGLLAVLEAANACGGDSGGNGQPSGSGALGGTTNGTCTLDAMPGTDTELAPLNGNGALVAVNSTYVYFTQTNAVLASTDLLRVARTGSTSEVLTHLDYVGNMLVDANSIYIRTYDGISKVSKTGGSSTSFASISNMGLGAWLAQDATHVYAIDDDTLCDGHGAIYAFDKQTGAKTVIAGNLKCPNALALDSNDVYFVEQVGTAHTDTALMRTPLTGGTPTQLARTSVDWSPGIALSGSYVYFAADVEPGDVTSGEVLLRVPATGGSVEQVLPCVQLVTGIQSGSDGVYFGNSYGLATNNGNSYTLLPSNGSSPATSSDIPELGDATASTATSGANRGILHAATSSPTAVPPRGHSAQAMFRFRSTRSLCASRRFRASSSGMVAPCPKYISSGVWPRKALCGVVALCSAT